MIMCSFIWIFGIHCTWLKILLKIIVFYVTTKLQQFFQFHMLVLLSNVVSSSRWDRSGMPCRPHASLTVDSIIVRWVWNQVIETTDTDKTSVEIYIVLVYIFSRREFLILGERLGGGGTMLIIRLFLIS